MENKLTIYYKNNDGGGSSDSGGSSAGAPRTDANGVMGLGWYEENGKTYYLQEDMNDNWYGKAVTGSHVINGVVYNFDASGVLIS